MNKVRHHVEERLSVSGGGIREKKVQHAQHERSLKIRKRIVSIHCFAGVKATAENQGPNVHYSALANALQVSRRDEQSVPVELDEIFFRFCLVAELCVHHAGIFGEAFAQPLIAIRAPKNHIAPPLVGRFVRDKFKRKFVAPVCSRNHEGRGESLAVGKWMKSGTKNGKGVITKKLPKISDGVPHFGEDEVLLDCGNATRQRIKF